MFFARHILGNGRKLDFQPGNHFLSAVGLGLQPLLLQQYMAQGCGRFGLTFAQSGQALMRGGLRDIGRGCLLGGRINLRACRSKLGGGFINHHAGLMPADVERCRLDAANLPGNIFISAGLSRLTFQLPKFSFKRLQGIVHFFQIVFCRAQA